MPMVFLYRFPSPLCPSCVAARLPLDNVYMQRAQMAPLAPITPDVGPLSADPGDVVAYHLEYCSFHSGAVWVHHYSDDDYNDFLSHVVHFFEGSLR